MKAMKMAAVAMLALPAQAAELAAGEEGADRPSRTTCLTPQYQQEYYDRVTTATVKVIFEKIQPAQAQVRPFREALRSARESLDACSASCEPHQAALQEATGRFEKAKAESDVLLASAAAAIVATTRRIRAEYAPCPEEKTND
jgi:hypothetical protein